MVVGSPSSRHHISPPCDIRWSDMNHPITISWNTFCWGTFCFTSLSLVSTATLAAQVSWIFWVWPKICQSQKTRVVMVGALLDPFQARHSVAELASRLDSRDGELRFRHAAGHAPGDVLQTEGLATRRPKKSVPGRDGFHATLTQIGSHSPLDRAPVGFKMRCFHNAGNDKLPLVPSVWEVQIKCRRIPSFWTITCARPAWVQ